jgi:glycolate oxidase
MKKLANNDAKEFFYRALWGRSDVQEKVLGFAPAVSGFVRLAFYAKAWGDERRKGLALAEAGYRQARGAEYGAGEAKLNESLGILSGAGREEDRALILKYLSFVHTLQGRFTLALDDIESSLSCYLKLDDREGWAAAVNNKGNILQRMGRVEESLACFQLALETSREKGNLFLESAALSNLAMFYARRDQFDAALVYQQATMALRSRMNDLAGLASGLLNLGNIHHMMGRTKEGMDCWEKAEELSARLGDYSNVASIKFNRAELHDNLDQPELAFELYGQALDIRLEKGETQDLTQTVVKWAGMAVKLDRFEGAVKERAATLLRQVLQMEKVSDEYWDRAEKLLSMINDQMKQHDQLSPETLQRLGEIVGGKHMITVDEGKEPYSRDETLHHRFMPAAVAKPADTAGISAIMKLASSEKIPVTPRGGGTGLSGGALPVYGGIVLSLERLNSILEIDRENMMVVTQPAVITKTLQQAVEEQGLFYPPDPASLDSCSIGGNVAENAGGPRAFKYGVTRHYLCGLEVVWPSGEVSRLGGKTIKNVSGYDLMHLICGSEGTLAVITEITLRLLPRPKLQTDLLIPFPSIAAASQAAGAIVDQRILPATMEFMEQKALRAAEEFLKKRAPFREAEAHLLIQLDGDRAEDLRSQYERIGEIVSGHEAIDVLVAEDRPSQERLWEMRRALSEALTQKSPVREREDVVVPKSRIPELFERMSLLSKKHETEIVSFGHIGDGNVHVNILKEKINDKAWQDTLPVLLRELFQIVVSLGGTVSGEHGIGYVKKEFLPLAVDNPALEMMKAVKRAWDPDEILNPGKIFP